MMATNCLEYGITVNYVSVNTGIEKGTWALTFITSTGQQAYNDLEAVPPVGSSGKAKPLVGGQEAKPLAPKLKAFW